MAFSVAVGIERPTAASDLGRDLGLRSVGPSASFAVTSLRTMVTIRGVWIWASALSLAVVRLSAQDTNGAEDLQRQLQQLREESQRTQQELQRRIESLERQIQSLPTNAISPATSAPRESAVGEPKPAWSPDTPVRLLGSSRSYLNLSLDALIAAGGTTAENVEDLQLGGHDPRVNGFTLQNLELVLDGAVDPYFRAQANLIFQIDSEGESNFEVEEAYAETTSLPGNFQVKAGQFQTEFGRLNPTHPHSWSFVDVPLINGRFFGEDGLRNPGARLSWLTPLPFYSELFLAVQNSFGETASSFASDHDGEPWFGRPAVDRSLDSFGELLFTPRWAVSFDPSPTVTVLAGASAAVGPNASGGDTATQVYGVDAYLKWKAANHHGGFPFVAWQTEAMIRRYEAGAYDGSDPAQPDPLPAETLTDYGFYTQLTCGFRKGWVVGLRGDWVSADSGAFEPDPDRDPRWRISPNLTWFPTEYSKLRLQYNLDDREAEGVDHSVWLQMEFTLGAHAAHKF